MYDVIVIGAGITGSLLSYRLSQYKLNVLTVERCHDIADGATMANSAIVHTGYDPEDGTLKAKLNVQGARMYEQLTKDLGCVRKVVGAYIAAVGPEEEEKLDVLADRAERRGITHAFLSGEQARTEEPNLSDAVTKVLSFPTTAVIYPWEVAIAAMQASIGNGTELKLDTEVRNIEKKDGFFTIKTNQGSFDAKMVINCSGTHADTIARMVSGKVPYHITPRRGEYYVLDQDTNFVHHVIFPVPGKKGKGVLAVPTVYGNVLLGPNSDYCDDPDDNENTVQGLDYVRTEINKTMKNVPFQHAIRTFAGLRPSSSSKDFVIQEYEDALGFVDVASIESPGLASAPAVAEYVISNFVEKHLSLEKKPDAVMTRKRPLVMAELTPEQRNEAIAKNPAYGRIICRCEQISEGEIADCIHAVCGARSVKGVKKRVRPGMGKCQGGFCEPRVVEMLARELKESPLEVVLDGEKSKILESENR